ncbi:molybdopterin molybdotransferase MoeA [Staphylococcus sp. SQ8-PEA]|uniref:Molybdopterin molybdenumtransferase n=1 Tax=Staphylococcus marylandisciuri TaxID=2981529 RepID=A0ABT2QMI4_9STAP|nr:gephyrin-like molybdotransferase Glp [Staphylococcus marylandisciuri]MCU5745180.1 molybdopterin molybdotransferase MoeA [Staphylococcus marylandisciuri]
MPVEKRTPIPVREAVNRVIKQDILLGTTEVDLDQSTGYILAEDIVATYEIPRFDKSPYDGYALRSKDTLEASGERRIEFKVIDHIGAGSVSSKVVGEFEAVRIMTGAQIPEGADAVVMLEQTVEDQDTFTIRKPFKPGDNIAKKGEETQTGDVVLEKGQVVNPGAIAVLATYGYTKVPVYIKPSIGIIATGSELLEVGDDLEEGKIRNSNGPMLASLCQKMGIEVESYHIQQDDLESSIEAVNKALETHHIVITTGGVSVGDYDYLPEIYKAINATILFNKIAMRPGSVTTVAVANGQYLFGLSGNPSACFTGFELYVKPAVYKMMGAKKYYPQIVQATLMEDFMKPNPFTRFIRGIATFDGQQMTVSPAGFNKSGAVVSIAHSNAMIILPKGTRGYKKGYQVNVILTESQAFEEEFNI